MDDVQKTHGDPATCRAATVRCQVHSNEASALVIILFLLTIILVIVIAFASSMRLEGMAAHNNSQGQRADLMVESSLAHAVSLLANNIPDPADPTKDNATVPGSNWFINPGQLTVIDSSDNKTIIPLYTGTASGADPIIAANLNAVSPTTGKYAITGSSDPMWVGWVNVLQDPTGTASISNPVIGRYAFWIDDECAKINFNVARGKPVTSSTYVVKAPSKPAEWQTPDQSYLTRTFTLATSTGTYPYSHPAAANLDSLGIDVVKLDADIQNNGYFNNPEAIKNYILSGSTLISGTDPRASNFYEQNKFSLTPFSRSPEFNVFGKSRLFISKNTGDLATSGLYQHYAVPEQPMIFWGSWAIVGDNTAAPKDSMAQLRDPVTTALAKYIYRSDWPGYRGKTFRWITNASGPDKMAEADQVAVNMSSMGYWGATGASSNADMTDSLFRWTVLNGEFTPTTGGNTSLWKGPLSGRPMLPPYPGPLLTEVGVTVTTKLTGTNQWNCNVTITPEVYQPWSHLGGYDSNGNAGFVNWGGGGSVSYDLRLLASYCQVVVNTTTNTVSGLNTEIGTFSSSTQALPQDGFTQVPFGSFYIGPSGTSVPTSVGAMAFTGTANVTVKVRLCMRSGNGGVAEIVPTYIPIAEDPNAPASSRAPVEDDSTLSITVPVTSIGAGSVFKQSVELTDPSKASWKANWVNTGTTTLGSMNSQWTTTYTASARSKFVTWNMATTAYRASSIGMFSMIPVGINGTPWDTLQFHSYTVQNSDIPDWALLDLVAPWYGAPISQSNSTAGKINLNTKIYPAGNPYFAPPDRKAPLNALLLNMPNQTANAGADAIRAYQDNGGYFDYIGKVCLVPKIADFGTTDYEKESIIRNMASLFTTQSNTFSVWGVAQTVKKSKSGTNFGIFENGDKVTSERRFYAVVERYVWPGKDGVPGNGSIAASGSYGGVADKGSCPPGSMPAPTPKNDSTNPVIGMNWALVDGPQAPNFPSVAGNIPYSYTDIASANNPLAALMKYRIIYFTYIN